MTTDFEYALMAGGSYISSRSDINLFPVPQGWIELIDYRRTKTSSGFEATTFTKGTEIVISFSGTDPTSFSDGWADLGLAGGLGSEQLRQAAAYYLQIKNDPANAGKTITFTGHSLGGGLAALMGVFFNETAVTFDQAPFAASATTLIRNYIITYLENTAGYTEDQLIELAPDLMSFTGLEGREGNVSGYFVQGEILSTHPFISLSRIGEQIPLSQAVLDPTLKLKVDLHSQELLTIFLENPTFRGVTFTLPDMVRMVFDEKLFSYPTNDKKHEDFLGRILRHEIGNTSGVATADGMLDRFTADLWKIAQADGLTLGSNDISKTLIAFAMQFYYENSEAVDPEMVLFDPITGGIHFDFEDVASIPSKAKGYQFYFQDYINSLPDATRIILNQELPGTRDWYIQAGSSALSVTAGSESAFMLGGAGNDSLTGSSLGDVLIGNEGSDTLTGGSGSDFLIGGTGNDTLNGGAGYDTYVIEGNDTIQDSDGLGILKNKELKVPESNYFSSSL